MREFWFDAADRAPTGLAYQNRTESGRLRDVLQRMQKENPSPDKEIISPLAS